jgi:hypothetical protein
VGKLIAAAVHVIGEDADQVLRDAAGGEDAEIVKRFASLSAHEAPRMTPPQPTGEEMRSDDVMSHALQPEAPPGGVVVRVCRAGSPSRARREVVGTSLIGSGVSGSIKILLAIVSAVVLVSSCTDTKEQSPSPATPAGSNAGTAPFPTPSDQAATDYASLADALEAEGHKLRVRRHTGLEEIFGVPGRTVSIDGDRVLAFEYPSRSAFEKLRSSVNRRGDMVGSAIIDWFPPHLYGSGRLVVVYLGGRRATLRTLEQLLGQQFAGV